MEISSQEQREIRAARNQSLFRAVNEKLKALNAAFASTTETFTIACECADETCTAMVDIGPDEYLTVRSNPRQFAVLPGHVYPDVEAVIGDSDRYTVVEKLAAAAEVAEATAP